MNTAANITASYLGDRDTATNVQHNVRLAGETMLALVWHGKEKVRVEQVPIPTITEPKDAIVRITGTTVCGSDLHLYHGEIMQLKGGDILGHEFCGEVVEVGADVKAVGVGERVVASFQIACGECEFCKEGLTSMCDRTNTSKIQETLYGKPLAGLFGYSHFTGGYAGGQAEYARVPFADNNLLKIPDSVPDEKALYLSDIIPTSYQAVLCAEVEKGNSIAIWGLGPIGLLAAQWSRHFGARRIIAIDNVPERLALAKDKFNCDVINFDEQKDVVSAIYGLEPQGVTNAIDAAAFRYSKSVSHAIQRAMCLETDTPEILNEALRATRKFGTIALVADYAATTNGLLIGAIMEKGLTVRGTGQTPVQKYWHDMLAKVESGEFDPTTVLTHRYKIEDLAEVYAIFDRKEGGVLKTFVQTKFSRPKAEGTPELTRLERTSESD